MNEMKLTVPHEDAGKRIDSWLSEHIDGLTRSAVQNLLAEQAVNADGKSVKKNYKLAGGEVLTVIMPELREVDLAAEDIPLDIVYEDEHILLINKPSGMLSQKAKETDESLVEYLIDYLLDSGHDADTLLVEVSFYTLNAGYNTDRFATLEETLNNPLAYCFNLEYNVNALTVAMDTLRGTPDTIESGDWVEADYLADDGTVLPLHRKLYDYTATITPRCKSWALNDEQFNRLHTLARRCQSEGVRLIVVLPPMADNVRTEVCDVFGITETMQGTVLPTLAAWADECGFTLLDYEWGGSVITDDDKQFFDGFHLDERYGLPEWTQELFGDIAR